jgi:hypothetical protein
MNLNVKLINRDNILPNAYLFYRFSFVSGHELSSAFTNNLKSCRDQFTVQVIFNTQLTRFEFKFGKLFSNHN